VGPWLCLTLVLLWGGSAAAADLGREVAAVLAGQSLSRLTREQLQGLDLAGVLDSLQGRDRYARYFTPADYAALRASGQTVGIGVQLYEDQGRLFLIPYPGGPAYRAGLRERVRLLRVDGAEVDGEALERVAARVQGPAGAPVRLELEGASGGPTRSLSVARAPFTPPAAAYLKEDDLALVRIWSFVARETLPALRDGVTRILASDQPVIIDLRDAQGGDLFEALDATSLFLDGGLPVAAVDYMRSGRKTYESLPGQRLTHQPVILLVGPGTASAAEAFARALHWYKVALLVGQATYGKCVTQTIVPLSNGGAIKFSNGLVLGPQGSPCEEQGIQPDVPVERADEHSVRSLLRASAEWVRRRTAAGS
jgi:carboxyl-terminal processing protease